MAKYKIWDKEEDIYTPSGERFTAMQWLARYPWANIPNAKMIISDGIINGGCAMEFTATVDYYKKAGAEITEGMTDAQILTAIEEFEDRPPEPVVSAEDRIADALEFEILMNY